MQAYGIQTATANGIATSKIVKINKALGILKQLRNLIASRPQRRHLYGITKTRAIITEMLTIITKIRTVITKTRTVITKTKIFTTRTKTTEVNTIVLRQKNLFILTITGNPRIKLTSRTTVMVDYGGREKLTMCSF